MRKFSIKLNGVLHEVEVEELSQSAAPVAAPAAPVAAPAAPVAAAPAAPAAAPAAPAAPAAAPASAGPAGAVAIKAPLPGTVVNVCVREGQTVAQGEPLLIVEAMKMENEIVAPQAGTVATINVAKGSVVNADDLLITLE